MSILDWIIVLTPLISCDDRATHIIETAIAIRTSVLPELRTGPVRSFVSLGMRSPIADTAKVDKMINTISLKEMQFFIYVIRSGMPSSFCGSGR